eukprot:10395-Eustigmatos_ZCMA.PRE.1
MEGRGLLQNPTAPTREQSHFHPVFHRLRISSAESQLHSMYTQSNNWKGLQLMRAYVRQRWA